MATTPQGEEPGFEADVNELPEDQDNGNPNTLEDDPDDLPESAQEAEMEEVQEQAAEERKEGGYQ